MNLPQEAGHDHDHQRDVGRRREQDSPSETPSETGSPAGVSVPTNTWKRSQGAIEPLLFNHLRRACESD